MKVQSTCPVTGKVKLTKGHAQNQARRFWQTWNARMDAYQCAGCGAWHIGHRRARKPRRRRRR